MIFNPTSRKINAIKKFRQRQDFLLTRVKILLLILLIIAGCASPEPLPVVPVIPETPEEMLRAKEIWQKIDEQKGNVENNPEWINNSYKGIKIRSLANIPIDKYADYKKFLDNGRVYLINHPAFYTFFQHPTINRKDNSMAKNIMDILIEDDAPGESSSEKARYNKRIMKTIIEFEKIGRNFLEFASTSRKLIILILPGEYKKYQSYRYKDGADEYSRYINEVTNISDSVLYLESRKPNRGQLTDEDMNTLIEFLQKTGTTSILLGGEYIGRCQEDFYKQLSEAIGTSMAIEIIPELSPVSPEDMNTEIKDLLDSNNKLDVQAAAYNILKNKYQNLSVIPKIRNLGSRMSYEKLGEK